MIPEARLRQLYDKLVVRHNLLALRYHRLLDDSNVVDEEARQELLSLRHRVPALGDQIGGMRRRMAALDLQVRDLTLERDRQKRRADAAEAQLSAIGVKVERVA